MVGRPLVVVSFRLDVEQEAPFSEFYNHRYLPGLMHDVSAIRSAWRYQEHHVAGSLKYYRKQFLTIFECGSRLEAEQALLAIETRPAPELQKWRALAMHDVEPPCLYLERWAHPRKPMDGNFGSRPIFLVSVELSVGQEQRFNDWYEQD